MKTIVLFDGKCHTTLLPLTFTRPVASIRVGICTILEKWEHFFNQSLHVRCKDYLAEKYSSHEKEADLGILGGLLPDQQLVDYIDDLPLNSILMKQGVVLAISPLPENNEDLEKRLEKYSILEYDAPVSIVNTPQDIFLKNGQELSKDFEWVAQGESNEIGESNVVFGDQIFIEKGAQIRGSIINCEDGPVYIGKEAIVMEGSLIKGPFALLNNSTLKMGAKIYGPTTFGPHCKVGGEVGNSVIIGYSNKAHDGYLGNSVIGEWCNLGADTNTSNLKNNYSNVKTWSYSEAKMLDTGTQYCGLTMGDHSKCGINTMFNTGTVVGVSANVFGGGFPEKFIPSFSWGGKDGVVDFKLDKALSLADVVMKRRGLSLSSFDRNILSQLFDLTAKNRK